MPKQRKPQKTLQDKRYDAAWWTVEAGFISAAMLVGFLTHQHNMWRWVFGATFVIGTMVTWVFAFGTIIASMGLKAQVKRRG